MWKFAFVALALIASPVAAADSPKIIDLVCPDYVSIDLEHETATDVLGVHPVVVSADEVRWTAVNGLINTRLDRSSLRLVSWPSTREPNDGDTEQCKIAPAKKRAF